MAGVGSLARPGVGRGYLTKKYRFQGRPDDARIDRKGSCDSLRENTYSRVSCHIWELSRHLLSRHKRLIDKEKRSWKCRDRVSRHPPGCRVTHPVARPPWPGSGTVTPSPERACPTGSRPGRPTRSSFLEPTLSSARGECPWPMLPSICTLSEYVSRQTGGSARGGAAGGRGAAEVDMSGSQEPTHE